MRAPRLRSASSGSEAAPKLVDAHDAVVDPGVGFLRLRAYGAARSLGFETMNPGTMYRALRQMEKDGVVESSWETSRGGAARRMYAITDAGEAYLGF